MWPELLQQVVLVMTTSSKPVLMFTKPHVVKRPLKTSRPVPLDVGQIKVQRCSFFFYYYLCLHSWSSSSRQTEFTGRGRRTRRDEASYNKKSQKPVGVILCQRTGALGVENISAVSTSGNNFPRSVSLRKSRQPASCSQIPFPVGLQCEPALNFPVFCFFLKVV